MPRATCLLLLLAGCLLGRAVWAQTPVDVALVLAVDASGSISESEFRLQKEGIAQALTDDEVVRTLTSGSLRRAAIAYVEWGSPGGATTVVGWMIVEDLAGAEALAHALLQAPRSPQSYNAIGDAIDHSAALLQACPVRPSVASSTSRATTPTREACGLPPWPAMPPSPPASPSTAWRSWTAARRWVTAWPIISRPMSSAVQAPSSSPRATARISAAPCAGNW